MIDMAHMTDVTRMTDKRQFRQNAVMTSGHRPARREEKCFWIILVLLLAVFTVVLCYQLSGEG